jgi:hypothetical protein
VPFHEGGQLCILFSLHGSFLYKDVESVDGKVIVEKDVLASATAEIAKLSMRTQNDFLP